MVLLLSCLKLSVPILLYMIVHCNTFRQVDLYSKEEAKLKSSVKKSVDRHAMQLQQSQTQRFRPPRDSNYVLMTRQSEMGHDFVRVETSSSYMSSNWDNMSETLHGQQLLMA